MPSTIWFTCPRCALQFKAATGHNHHCPRCHQYPCQIGKLKIVVLPQQPRITTQLPPPTPSGTFPSMPGYDQPAHGQFTQAGWPSSPQPPLSPVAPARPPNRRNVWARRFWQWYRQQTWRIRIGVASGVATILLLCCIAGLGAIVATNPQASETPTPGAVAQATRPAGQPTASTGTGGPAATTQLTATATPTPPCPFPAVMNNPWCYTFTNTGKLIFTPDPGFCGLFDCISSFENGVGYVVECHNGQYSKSGGRSGVCSKQGGFLRNLYMP